MRWCLCVCLVILSSQFLAAQSLDFDVYTRSGRQLDSTISVSTKTILLVPSDPANTIVKCEVTHTSQGQLLETIVGTHIIRLFQLRKGVRQGDRLDIDILEYVTDGDTTRMNDRVRKKMLFE